MNNTRLLWLIVGGCARSGTTVLGHVITSDKRIGLLHENTSWSFFHKVSSFFQDEERHRRGNAFHVHSDALFLRDDMERPLIEFLFREKFGDGLLAIGTKTPAYYDLAEPVYPSYVDVKTIHITRDPLTNIDSLVKFLQTSPIGGETEVQRPQEHSLLQWMRAWNAAVIQSEDPDRFCHFFLDDLLLKPDESLAKLRGFLGFDAQFDRSILHKEPRRIAKSDDGWRLRSGDSVDPLFDLVPVVRGFQENWPDAAQQAFARRQLVGWPLHLNESVSFEPKGRGSYYKSYGFSGITGTGIHAGNGPSVVTFTLGPDDISADGSLRMLMDVSARLGRKNEPLAVAVRVNDGEAETFTFDNATDSQINLHLPMASLGEDRLVSIRFEPVGRVSPRSSMRANAPNTRYFSLRKLYLERTG